MTISIKNPEGYPDPTAHEALVRIWAAEKCSKHHPLVFICSPYSGDTNANTHSARRYCRFAVEQDCLPIAPHLLFPQFLDDADDDQRATGLLFARILLGKCRELWVFESEITRGMAEEINRARNRGIPTRYFDTNCQEVQPQWNR